MKAITNIAILTGALLISATDAIAQFKLSGEVRPRFEYRHGFQTLADSAMKPGAFVDQRTRLNFEYKREKIEFKVVAQDVRVWGSQSQLVTNEDYGISIHEAFGIARLGEKWALKFGRQELVYDDHRMLGNVDWAQQARSHDGLLVQFKTDKLKLDIGASYNQDMAQNNTTNYTVLKSYKTMQFAWANYKVSDLFNASFLVLSVGQQANYTNTAGNPAFQDNYTLTAGTRLTLKKGKFGATSNLFYQLGSANTFPAKSVSGYLLNLDLSFQIKDPLKVFAGFEMISGNSQTDTSAAYKKVQHAFNPYFGTNHKFNGYMDYFYVGNHVGSVGLNDSYFGVELKNEKLSLELAGHIFMSQADILDVDELVLSGNYTAMSPYLGTEIDITGGIQIVPGVQCKFGYSHMLGSESMKAIKGGSLDAISNWGYVSFILKPVLFEQKP